MIKKAHIILLLALIVTASCSDGSLTPYTTTGVTVNYTDDMTDMTISDEQLIFKNISTGAETTISVGQTISLPEGLYDCTYKASVQYLAVDEMAESVTMTGTLNGFLESIKITGSEVSFTIDVYLSISKDDFIIEEIFFTGTLRTSGSQYYGDSYVKIYNNTDNVLYADGLAFVESKFLSTQYYDYTPNIRADEMTIHAIYVIPGSGTDYPVQPGESLILCDTGINHTLANSNSFDLSEADFEWYDVSTSPSYLDIDSPTVTNLDKWYCYTLSFFVLHNRGYKSYALARIPVDMQTYLTDYQYTYTYTMYLAAGTFPMEQDAYRLPNSWIVDGVNCSVETERVWNILPASVDAGWTHCGYTDSDATRYFKSVRRKANYITEDGIKVLQDTGNSTDDFNTECIPSIIEDQQTSIDANGTKATTRTWDGVLIRED